MSFYDYLRAPLIDLGTGTVHTFQRHWFRMLAPTVLLALFLFFPIPIGAASLLPQVTAWLLGNVVIVILIPTITFSVGYLLFQLSRPFLKKDEKEISSGGPPDAKGNTENKKGNKSYVLYNVGRFLMWSAIGFGLFAALFTPAIPAFLQNGVIGNGINTGFVMHLFTFNSLGIIPLVCIIAGALIVGAFLSHYSEELLGGTTRTAPASRSIPGYLFGKLGVTFVYASIFASIFLLITGLSSGSYTGLAIGFTLAVGPVLAKSVAKLGQITRWISALAKKASDKIATYSKALALRVGIVSSVGVNKVVNPESAEWKQQISDKTTDIRRSGPSSRGGKLALAVFNVVQSALVLSFHFVHWTLGEVSKIFDALEGKMSHRSEEEYYPGETPKYYEPIMHGHDLPLFCSKVQIALAECDAALYSTLTTPNLDDLKVGEGQTLPRIGVM